MSGFVPSLVHPSAVTCDPAKHVSYELGMVLGVDDLTQEFAYHAHRQQWIPRDLIGYGTSWGLALSSRVGAKGPEVVVASGVAVIPRGQIVRVAPAQCAPLNEWLAARTSEIDARRAATTTPGIFQVTLHVRLGYRECLTDPAPIAGEPCRSESDSMAPSRVTDDFLLELSFDPPPDQAEDNALRELMAWLNRHVVVTGAAVPSGPIQSLLDELGNAADRAALPVSPAGPPGAGPFLVDLSPPFAISVPQNLLPEYMRAALRYYVTSLRPRWRPSFLGDKHACPPAETPWGKGDGNSVLLGTMQLKITRDLDGITWKVAALVDAVRFDEQRRPFLLTNRFLEEWTLMLTGGIGGGGPVASRVVALGVVNADGTASTRAQLGNPIRAAASASATANTLTIKFDGYPGVPPNSGAPQLVVQVAPQPLPGLANPERVTASVAGFDASGVQVLVSRGGVALGNPELAQLRLHLVVTRIG